MTTAHLAHGTLLSVAPTPIASGVIECLGRFDELLLDLHAHEEYEPFSKAISDALGRFKIWSSNIGAHRTGKRSLDHRLRDASHLKEQVLRLLTSLTDNLGDGKYIPKPVMMSAHDSYKHEKLHLERESHGISYR
jgi:hypothetical protein